ncbi:beta-ketoacyl synthase N-terminal-like domain-containing protein [Streptomyces sp. cmx-4-9]|uniref:beta-ketoacyl synthase N-terminal-like domain-containing protein n=1 Tax=Streptomyces sp. cmx-4-9 TaxID=2790941 RepID=UPI003980A18F
MVTAVRGPVITGWSAVSPFGIGREAFAEGVRSGRPAATALDAEQWGGADEQACLVPDFAIRDVLGRKGTRSMDRVTGLAVTAIGRLIEESGGSAADLGGESAALVLGTNTGSAQSMMDLTRDTFLQEKPFYVDPSHFPNTVMNCASGQCAIWYGLKGPNATVAAGRASGLMALNYARRLLAAGRARTVLCGAVEEYSAARSWLELHVRGADESDTVLGEGCAVLKVEPADSVPPGGGLAEVLLVEAGIVGPQGVAASLTACIERAVRRSGVRPEDVWAVSPSSPAGAAGAEERAALQAAFGAPAPRWVPQPARMGDTSAATATFQVVSVLALAAEDPAARGRTAVVTSVDRDGALACALLRLR